MNDIIPSAIQPAALSGLILIILTAIGWFVVSRIGRLARDSSHAIAEMASGITRQQLAVAQSQMEVNKQVLILNMMPARTQLHEELVEAINGRSDEINKNDYQHANFSTDQLKKLWKAQTHAKRVFGPDVQAVIQQIVDQLEAKEKAISHLRTNIPSSDMSAHDAAADAAWKVEELKGELAALVLSYSSLGHVRSLT